VHFDSSMNLINTAAVSSRNDSFDAAIRAHDEAVAASGLDIWIGAEPTFTNRFSEAHEWLREALGESKQAYACRMIRHLRETSPGAIILRTLGRQYPDEPRPRWSLGLYRRRDGMVFADGLPQDPLDTACACDVVKLESFWRALKHVLDRDGWSATGFQSECEDHGDSRLRVLFRTDSQPLMTDPASDCRFARAPVQSRAIPPEGIIDDLAEEGSYLVAIGCAPSGPDDSLQPCIELPGFGDVDLFHAFLRRVASAARDSGVTRLVWRGFPPPVDASVAWMTLTPDPAVVEVNEAPEATAGEFLTISRKLFTIAQHEGLAPYRLNYNGNISESGGGGQFTLGGPSPARSPFFVSPHLLSHLVTYLNHHPSLSYWFAPVYIGSHSQSPRSDENVRESFSELKVTLRHLNATTTPQPEFIWNCLSPFMVDTTGNAHRSEINIEKLWNPYLPGRGHLGLVEFRAFRMAMDAESATAIAAMLRAIVAMLARRDTHQPLIDWGNELHDRFALPYYQLRDLRTVFDDLAAAGFGLGSPITERLCTDQWRHIGDAEFAGCRLDVDFAVEFWPLIGDATEQAGGSRLVDASTLRLQITLRPIRRKEADLGNWQLLVNRFRIPMRRERDESGHLSIAGLRYRAFVPWIGLHPGLGAQTPIVLILLPPGGESGLRCILHDWQPDGLAYEGLPVSIEEARRRIAERFVVEAIAPGEIPDALTPPVEAISDYCLDLRQT
jgi:uncharacterized protein (DUF2126 family)